MSGQWPGTLTFILPTENVPRARKAKVVLKPFTVSYLSSISAGYVEAHQVQNRDETEELDEVLGHLFQTRQKRPEVWVQA
jgi:hypothetical protein